MSGSIFFPVINAINPSAGGYRTIGLMVIYPIASISVTPMSVVRMLDVEWLIGGASISTTTEFKFTGWRAIYTSTGIPVTATWVSIGGNWK